MEPRLLVAYLLIAGLVAVAVGTIVVVKRRRKEHRRLMRGGSSIRRRPRDL